MSCPCSFHNRVNAPLHQIIKESAAGFLVASFEVARFVIGNEIDIGIHSLDELREAFRILEAVVDSRKQMYSKVILRLFSRNNNAGL